MSLEQVHEVARRSVALVSVRNAQGEQNATSEFGRASPTRRGAYRAADNRVAIVDRRSHALH
jgi:hypothetical protein